MGGFKDLAIAGQGQGKRDPRRGPIINQTQGGGRKPAPQESASFDGKNVTQADKARLSPQLQLIWDLMKDGRWRTLSQITAATNIPEASASARLRDFRKPRNGGHTIDAKHAGGGLWQYRLIRALPPGQGELF